MLLWPRTRNTRASSGTCSACATTSQTSRSSSFGCKRRRRRQQPSPAATLSACASKIEQEIRRLDVRHVELSAGVEEAALALYCHTRGRRDIRIAAVKRGGCHTQSPKTLSEIRHTTTVRTYINCGCITIWDEAVS